MKMRLGLNQFEKQNKTYLNTLKHTNADSYIIHARHGRQTSTSKADWSIFEECLQETHGEKVIIANGDICTVEHINHFMQMKIHGVMIGRSCAQSSLVFFTLARTA